MPKVCGITLGSFVDTGLVAGEITDEIVKHIFQVWMVKYCREKKLCYNPRDNLLFTDIQKLAQIKMNLPHLVESKTQAGFAYEMEFIQLTVDD